jgi:HEAT repeat protein
VLPVLMKGLKDVKSYIRQFAVKTLGRMGPAAKEAIPALKKVAESDDDWDVREAAAALKKIQGPVKN